MSPRIVEWPAIEEALERIDPIAAMETAFEAYSAKRAVIGPVGELLFDEPPGEVHIKYGYLRGGPSYVVKIASGFYDNPDKGLPSCLGLMLVFDATSGAPQAVLLDEGRLTDLRTAAAGACAARHLAPATVETIGIVGTGTQARLQLAWLRNVTSCRNVLVWGRNDGHAEAMVAHARSLGLSASATSLERLARESRLIVTCTPARAPLLQAAWIAAGTHITAVGSDTADKQELDPAILARADRVVADSITQCRTRGEIHHALALGILDEASVVELGDVIGGRARGRVSAADITVADLTGVAVQDLAIATAVLGAISSSSS